MSRPPALASVAKRPPAAARALVRPRVDLARRRRAPRPFGPRARRCLAALTEAIAPDADIGVALDDMSRRVIDYLARFRPYLPWPLPSLIGPALALFDWLPLLLGPHRRRLSRLSIPERRRFLYRLLAIRGPVRDLTNSLRGLIALAIYEQPEVLSRMGYTAHAWIRRKVAERRERYGFVEPW